MNKYTAPSFSKLWVKLLFTLGCLVLSAITFAQDTKKIDANINTNAAFLASPWIWVIGISVFVLLMIALLRDDSRRSDA